MGTASPKEKMLQKLISMREEVLYVIFLDLYKVYDDFYKDMFLESWRDT